MGTVQKLAEKVKEGLQAALPKLRKTVINKLALAVGAMIEVQTPNTIELANVLPLPTEQSEIREQWLRRLLKNPLLDSPAVLEPFARTALEEAARHGQTVMLTLDQTDLSDRFAILMLALQRGGIGRCRWRGWWKRGRPTSALPVNRCCWSGFGRGCPRTQRCCCWETGSIPPPS